jgi:hypothetical protein
VKTIAASYSPNDLAEIKCTYAKTPYMVHVAGPDEAEAIVSIAGFPLGVSSSHRYASLLNNAFGPVLAATVFHFGEPLEAVDL